MLREGGNKIHLTFNWPNISKACAVACGLLKFLCGQFTWLLHTGGTRKAHVGECICHGVTGCSVKLLMKLTFHFVVTLSGCYRYVTLYYYSL